MLKPGGEHKALPKKHGHRRVSADRSILDIAEQAHSRGSYTRQRFRAEGCFPWRFCRWCYPSHRSAAFASVETGAPSAAAILRTVPQVGLASPRSIRESVPGVIPAFGARLSWLSPRSLRKARIASPSSAHVQTRRELLMLRKLDDLARSDLIVVAVGLLLALAAFELVRAAVENLIMPLVFLIFGQPEFPFLSFTIDNSDFAYGFFISAAIAFWHRLLARHSAVEGPSKVRGRIGNA
jgi:large-conductance mechanosensitive channel MscL